MRFSRNPSRLLKRLANVAYTIGVIMFAASLALTTGIFPASAYSAVVSNNADSINAGQGNCSDFDVKIENGPPWTYTNPSGEIITQVTIKAGSQEQGEACFTFTADGATNCYVVNGIGTSSITASDTGNSGCKEISHIEIQLERPTDTPEPPTATPTDTPEPPTATPTDTPEPPTETPTDTPEPPTETPTDTPEPPTATPTDTPVPPTETPTETPPVTVDPTETVIPPTDTPVPPTDTPVPPTETPIIPPSSPTPTDPPEEPTETSVPTEVPTLPPPDEPEETPILIPVTGVDLAGNQMGMSKAFANAAMVFIGLGLVLSGASAAIKEEE